MKSVATATRDTITNDYVNELSLVVEGEWKNNRFYRTAVDNTPSEDTDGYDVELFPIESISMSNRPTSGINKGVVNQARVEPELHSVVPTSRYYLSSTSDVYKYWQSPYPSATAAPYAMTGCAPQVTYCEDNTDTEPTPIVVSANKIHFTVETSWCRPVDYDIQVMYTTTDTWHTVASDIPVPDSGLVEIWYNGSTWSATKVLDKSTTLCAVRLVINNMNKYGYFNLIELGAAIELDLSKDTVNLQDNFNMGDPDFISPLGNISSNTGSLALFNDTRIYDNENPDSALYGILDRGATIRAWYDYDGDKVQEIEMVSDTWKEDDDATVTVSLIDNSKFLQDTTPPVVLYRNLSVQEIVWRLCDIIGFNKYEVTPIDESIATPSIVDIFWTDGQKSAWDTFSELARATQTAIYFDSFGVLQVKTRYAAWDDTKSEDYSFYKDTVAGSQLANMVSLTNNSEYEANKVTVNWKPTGFDPRIGWITPYKVVWKPDNDVVIRTSELVGSLTNQDYIKLSAKDGATWPWKGMCQIDGEWISYEGKQYGYYDSTRIKKWTYVNSYAAQKKLDAQSPPELKHLNGYNGKLKITERGAYNTDTTNHVVGISPVWNKGVQVNYGPTVNTSKYFRYNKGQSSITIQNPGNSGINRYRYLHRGNPVDQGYRWIGTRLKIDATSHSDKVGGIFFNSDTSLGVGYFIEVTASVKVNGKKKSTKNELMLYSMDGAGNKKVFGGETVVTKHTHKGKGKKSNKKRITKTKTDIGVSLAVPQNRYIDIDIVYSPGGAGAADNIQVWANGTFRFNATIPAGTWKHASGARFGLYARGSSSVTFDYAYAISNTAISIPTLTRYFDAIENDWQSTMIRDMIYETRKVRKKVRKKNKKVLQKYNLRIFDDFGPMVHEIRKFDVTFSDETIASIQAKLYSSNQGAAPFGFWYDPKHAHFMIANTSKRNLVLSGDDNTTGSTVNQKLFVYGRPVVQQEAQTIVKNDEWAQNRRGIIDIEFESDWIQNQSEANALSDWMTTHWSRSDTSLDVEVFGNPMIELCDVVHVKWDDIDDKFYVIAISNTFDSGLTTSLTLRKV